ncbi:MAG: cyclic nucleotide-binding domain-containing protein [Deltaproteobacteria bacterium]|nr:cyclic nucleotide-binding domain-containing protein [Deltaproteobacteria bacterium]MDQ3296364.1 cyclic nucleotide-binding domain-containing protein [Myxococcota bacterium]
MPTSPTLLERHPLLVHLAPEQLSNLARSGEIESYNPGEPIVIEGSLGDALFLILSGQVAVHRGAQTFATLQGGEFFGEMSLVEPAPRSASVSAMSPTFLFRLPHDALRDLITNDANAASILLVQVVKTLSERLRRANQMLSSVDMLADWLAGSMV